MGLFDKMRGLVDTAVDTINKSISSAKEEKEPLGDETVKKYYEIIFGMYKSINLNWVFSKYKLQIVKSYIEKQSGEEYDEEKAKKALELFELTRSDYNTSEKVCYLKDYNKKLDALKLYRDKTFDIYDLFYAEEMSIVKKEYNAIIEVVKDDPRFSLFIEGVDKNIFKKHSVTISSSAASELLRRVIMDSFFDGEPTIKKLMVCYVLNIYHNRIHRKKYEIEQPLHSVVLMALKALHFEKYGNDKENYDTITDDECLNVILNHNYYKSTLNDHPFDKEEYIKEFTDEIRCCIFRTDYSAHAHSYLRFSDNDKYFCDAVCNLVWKEIANEHPWMKNEEDISASTDVLDVIDILWTYFMNNAAN